MKKVVRRSVALAAMITLGGCYSYIPTDLAEVPPGNEVRLYMSRVALARLPEDIPSNGLYVRGVITNELTDSLTIRVPVTARQEGLIAEDIGQDVRVPVADVTGVQRRQFDGARTALAIGGAVVGGVAVGALVFHAVSSGPTRQDQNPDLARIPIFSIPVR